MHISQRSNAQIGHLAIVLVHVTDDSYPECLLTSAYRWKVVLPSFNFGDAKSSPGVSLHTLNHASISNQPGYRSDCPIRSGIHRHPVLLQHGYFRAGSPQR